MNNEDRGKQASLTLSDIPRLQALFARCDRSLLKRVILEDFAHLSPSVGKKSYRATHKRLDATLTAMLGLKLSKKTYHNHILMPKESFVFDAQTGFIERCIGADLVPLCDGATLTEMLQAEERVLSSCACVRSTDYYPSKPFSSNEDEAMKKPLEIMCDAQRYRLSFWGDILACRVWLGGPWCRRERYIALASVFWEMTYFGFEYDVVRRRIKEERAVHAQDGWACGTTGMLPEVSVALEGCDFGLHEPDLFEADYRKRIEERIVSMNRIASGEFLTQRLNLAQRLEGR